MFLLTLVEKAKFFYWPRYLWAPLRLIVGTVPGHVIIALVLRPCAEIFHASKLKINPYYKNAMCLPACLPACVPAPLPASLPAAPGSFRFSSFLLALLLRLLYFHLQPAVQEAALVIYSTFNNKWPIFVPFGIPPISTSFGPLLVRNDDLRS
jgi:hypothetical protein